ncbi:DUF3341 domain-containing protein [candidate division KSB1 bacterium]|nr:DUF3341 domain-containing protein [candidate division KSB1 bacterium]
MSQTFAFENKQDFLDKLTQLVKSGVSAKQISLNTPYHVHEVEHILRIKPSAMRFFAAIGALSGTVAGYAFTIFTVFHWPIITSGKPLISVPPYTIIAFALTILFGALISFSGFLILSRLPSMKGITATEEHENRFVIVIDNEDKS